jgi:hypothetical protein
MQGCVECLTCNQCAWSVHSLHRIKPHSFSGCSGGHESIRLDLLLKIFFVRAQTKKEICIWLKNFFVRAQAYVELLHGLARRLVDSTEVGFVALNPISQSLF